MDKKADKYEIKKIGAEIILMGIVAPVVVGFVFWFGSFVMTSAKVEARVEGQEQTLQQIRQDVKEIRDHLLGAKR